MAGPETHHVHHDIESLNRFEQDRGRISGEQMQGEINEWLGSLPDDTVTKIRDLLTGKEDGEVDDEKEGAKLLFYYLYTLYRLDVENAFSRVEAMDDADRQTLISTITGNPSPDAVLDDEDHAQLQALLTHFNLNTEGKFAKIFLKLYEEKFAPKKPTDALFQNLPSENDIETHLDSCVKDGGPAIPRLRIAIARLEKVVEDLKIDADFPALLKSIPPILDRLQAEEKKTEAPEKTLEEAKGVLAKKEEDLKEPEEKLKRAKDDLERERKLLTEEPDFKKLQKYLERAKAELNDAKNALQSAKTSYERAYELYLREAEVKLKETPPGKPDETYRQAAKDEYDEAKKRLNGDPNQPNQKGAVQVVKDAEDAIEKAEEDRLKNLKQAVVAAEKEKIAAERALDPFRKAVTDADRALKQAQALRKPIAQELKDIPRRDIHEAVRKFLAEVNKKKKAGEESFPKNQPGENIVYLCIKREREAIGEKADYLEKRTAHDTATLAVGATSVAFEGIEAAGKSAAEKARYQAQKGVAAISPAEWVRTLRSRTEKLFKGIPLLEGLQTNSPEHVIKHHFEKEPITVLVELLGYLRHEAAEQRQDAFWKGIPFHQLTDLERFVKVVEEIVAARLGDEIGKAGDKGWEKAHAVFDESLHKPLAHVAHKFDEVKRDLKAHHPVGGKKEGEGHGDGHGKGKAGKALEVAGAIGGALAGIGHIGDILRGRKPSGGGKDGGGKPSGGGTGGHEGGH